MIDPTAAYTPGPEPGGPRFAAGELLAGRFRVVTPLGTGGMGEVYRADDLHLGQPVALKFLPAGVANDPDRLARFRKEVAAARRVSHPHVCRVYDLGDHAGQPFLAMEFVDGEDLASVLVRLGRVPAEKGVEIARQLAGALAAVHDQGLVHRDLKPANVMLDGRGRVRLTDFGLAAAAAELSADDARSGTPAYQAPEQLAGREVTARSDLFALGLVLFELFTGKRAFPATGRRELAAKHAAGLTSAPSSLTGGLDPAVERVIVRCLEADPAKRPGSAAEVLAGLPGGDPLAAAVAAGETPSPQLVADAGEVGLIRPWVGAVLVAVVVAGLAVSVVARRHSLIARRCPLTASPAEMAQKGRVVLAGVGYLDPPADWFGEYWMNNVWLQAEIRRDPDRLARLSADDPAVTFGYREAAGRLVPLEADNERVAILSLNNPPPNAPGMAGVWLTTSGRLLRLYAVPQTDTPAGNGPLAEAVWRTLFTAAGLDFARFRPVPPTVAAGYGCDERLEWAADDGVRVAAARCGDRPTYFAVENGWTPAGGVDDGSSPASRLTVLTVLGLGGLLAWRNLWRGRADVRTAARLAVLVAAGQAVGWLVGGTISLAKWSTQLTLMAGLTGVYVATSSLLYLAVEPLVRRRWPGRLTGWQRLFAGRLRDPLVGRDVLVGAAAGVGYGAARHLADLAPSVEVRNWVYLPVVAPAQEFFGNALPSAVSVPLIVFALVYILYLVVRREWVAWACIGGMVSLLGVVTFVSGGNASVGTAAIILATYLVGFFSLVALLTRVGVLAYAAYLLAADCALYISPPAAWHAPTALAFAAGLFAVCVACAYTATGGRRLFREGFFGDD